MGRWGVYLREAFTYAEWTCVAVGYCACVMAAPLFMQMRKKRHKWIHIWKMVTCHARPEFAEDQRWIGQLRFLWQLETNPSDFFCSIQEKNPPPQIVTFVNAEPQNGSHLLAWFVLFFLVYDRSFASRWTLWLFQLFWMQSITRSPHALLTRVHYHLWRWHLHSGSSYFITG